MADHVTVISVALHQVHAKIHVDDKDMACTIVVEMPHCTTKKQQGVT